MQIDKSHKHNFEMYVNILLFMQHCFGIRIKFNGHFTVTSAFSATEIIDFEKVICILHFCHTCFSMGDLGMQVSVRPSVLSSFHQHLPWVSCERNSSYSLVPIILKLCMCFRHGMNMCIWFGYNCQIIFCHFFHIVNLVIFHLNI